MSEFNNFNLIGRLAENLEVYLDGNKKEFASWRLIINEPFKNSKNENISTYVSGVWYPKDIHVIKKYKKGCPVLVRGHIGIKKEKYSDGGNKYTPVLCADGILFLPKTQKEEIQ